MGCQQSSSRMGCQPSSFRQASKPESVEVVGLDGTGMILDVKHVSTIAGVKGLLAEAKGVATQEQTLLSGTRVLKSSDPIPAGTLTLVRSHHGDRHSSLSVSSWQQVLGIGSGPRKIDWQCQKVKLPTGAADIAVQAAIQAVEDAEMLDKQSGCLLTSKTPKTVLGFAYTSVGDDHNLVLQVRFQAHGTGHQDRRDAYRQKVRLVLREVPVASQYFTVVEAELEPKMTTLKLHRMSSLDMPDSTNPLFGGQTSNSRGESFDVTMCAPPVFC